MFYTALKMTRHNGSGDFVSIPTDIYRDPLETARAHLGGTVARSGYRVGEIGGPPPAAEAVTNQLEIDLAGRDEVVIELPKDADPGPATF